MDQTIKLITDDDANQRSTDEAMMTFWNCIYTTASSALSQTPNTAQHNRLAQAAFLIKHMQELGQTKLSASTELTPNRSRGTIKNDRERRNLILGVMAAVVVKRDPNLTPEEQQALSNWKSVHKEALRVPE
jgi:hypothetical protein